MGISHYHKVSPEEPLQNLKKLKITLMILASLFAASFTSAQQFNDSDKPMTVEYVNAEFQVISRPDLTQRVIVLFNVIPGGIWGQPLNETLELEVVDIGDALTTDFSGLQTEIEIFATTLLDTDANQQIEISPKETNLARLGTFSFDLESRENMGGTGFGSPDKDIHALVLTYFDRPAVLSGVQNMNGDTTEFRIDVKKKGLVWLKILRPAPNYYIYSVHELTGNEFLFIHPNQAADTES